MKASGKGGASSSTESVKVAVRCRPMNKKELGQSKTIKQSFTYSLYLS